jgi:hypothetical protein
MDKEIPKINCTTTYKWRCTKSGKMWDTEQTGATIVKDVTVEVSPKGMNILQKVMNQKNDKPKT